jgi:hypothetical protein
MTELLATWTAQLWKTLGTTYYLDGHRKAVFTDHLIPRGLIGRTGKILGCRALVLLHDTQGHPRFVTTGRGDNHLTQETTSVLKCYEEMVASEHVSTLVIDREGMSTDFLRRLTQDGRTIITILRSDQYTGLATFNMVGDFLPLQTDAQGLVIREVAPAQFQLDDLTLQVALIRDHRSQTTLPSADAVPRSPGFRWSDTGPMWWEPTWQATPTPALASEPRLIPIVTTAPLRDPQELVALYTRRWPVQENIIKDWLLPLGLDCNHGYAKTEVLNSEVAKRREGLQRRIETSKQRAQNAGIRSGQATKRAEKLKKRLKERGDELYWEINAYTFAHELDPDWYRHKVRVKEMKATADAELDELRGRYHRADQQANEEHDKQRRYCQQQCDLLRVLDDLNATERTMYELDHRKDQLMTVCKLMLTNLGMWVRDQYFPASYAHATWDRLAPFFRLPGDITRGKDCVTVKLRPFPDRQMNRDLTEVCHRIEAARLCLPDGLRVCFQIGRLT